MSPGEWTTGVDPGRARGDAGRTWVWRRREDGALERVVEASARGVAGLLRERLLVRGAPPTCERELQAAVGEALGGMATAEAVIGPRERIDFLVLGGVGVEVKTKGSARAVGEQLTRYSQCEGVTGLVLVTLRAAHRRAGAHYAGRVELDLVCLASQLL